MAIAIARKYNWNIAPYGSTALSVLGLSTQVPSKWIYHSSGRYKKYFVGKSTLEFKRVKPGEISNMSMMTATVIQAIRTLGEDSITNENIFKIREKLSHEEINNLKKESKSTSARIYEIIRKISEGADD